MSELQQMAPLTAEQWGDAEYAAFGALLGLPADKVPRAGSGEAYDPLNFDIIGMLAHHPEMARLFLRFNGFLLQRGELAGRLRELIILRVALRHRSAFEWGQHVRMGAAVGVTDDDVAALIKGNDGFSGADRIVLDTVDELIADGKAQWDTWQRLVDTVGERAAMEVVFLVGTYAMTGMAFSTWGLQAKPGSAPLPPQDPTTEEGHR
ncbi:carboxymuconolactone decarboxylase family protein [Mycolicibacterium diernhoferi]|uniref:Carboxymuconolactone decarboxylase n=1 Tax=Mycolicibacterium diernhoferi TaxID=1801 RepID=A0A1Q4H9D7_9MYCO|nr:carboxymuconolactone decarboxylase family protein [Mycolicibacterium diernhoferi]OJZ63991.1 carboxymuconolactone decarboxylase [Mycolicibacterium diernhoferi]OPE54146.1 carboxymuconolactone decarboxylase [Mycolicibacterium diernhoferi]PEG55625.1 carboxymuconolactone decarboxylase family protein [Mycolicibacterium diernhoferi]QYL20679.1 carboxymuconolactone decarboxylase family protein [Mycolicibacterium diernhoferi]